MQVILGTRQMNLPVTVAFKPINEPLYNYFVYYAPLEFINSKNLTNHGLSCWSHRPPGW